jgi:CBS domain-containing protein
MEGKYPPSVVRNVMAKPVITIETVSSVHKAAEIMGKKNVGSIIVTSEGKPVGIVTERDLVKKVLAEGLDPSKVQMKTIMSKPLVTVEGSVSILEAIRIMQRKKIRRILVVENKKLAGIISQRDLCRALSFHVATSLRPLLESG